MTLQADIEGEQPHRPVTKRRRAHHAASGQVLVLFGISLFVLVGFVGLAIDGGYIMAERRQAQSAADAGALAGAADLLAAKYAQIESSGQEYASDTADVEIGVDGNVDINCLPDPANCSTATQVEAIVTKDVDKFFVGAVYGGDWEVGARAVAAIDDVPIPNALIALEHCGDGTGIEVIGNPEIIIENGRAISNCGIDHRGSASSNYISADQFLAVGPELDCSSSWDVTCSYAPEPVDDPIYEAGVVPPTKEQANPDGSANIIDTEAELLANVTNLEVKGRNKYVCPNNGIPCRMNSGVYGGTLTLEVQGTLEFLGYGNRLCDNTTASAATNSTGIFYFTGDSSTTGFTLTAFGSNAYFCGRDVLLYFGPGNYGFPATNSWFDPVTAKIELHAYQAEEDSPQPLYPGGQPGMALWIDNCTPFVMQGGAGFNINGVIYAPCSYVELYGTPGTYGIQVIVGELVMNGTGQFTILYRDYVSTDTPMVFLVE